MNKFAVVVGVAAVATLSGCRDPQFDGGSKTNDNDVKVVGAAPSTPKAETVSQTVPVAISEPIVKKCFCAPGTKHTEPCGCGAADCQCVVVAKPVTHTPTSVAEPEYTVYIVQRGDYLAKISKKFNLTIGSIKRLNGMKTDVVRIGQKLKLPGKVDIGIQTAPAVAASTAAIKPVKAVKSATEFTGATKEYVVKSGDTLGAIAYGNGITMRQLRSMNNLASDSLKVGQKLKIPAEKQIKTPAKKATEKAAKPVEAPKAVTATPSTVGVSAATPAGAKPVTEVAATPAPAAAEPASVAADAAAPVAAEAAPPAAEQPAVKLNSYTVQEGDDITGVSIRWGVSAAEIRELNNLPEDAQLKPGQVLKLPADAQQ